MTYFVIGGIGWPQPLPLREVLWDVDILEAAAESKVRNLGCVGVVGVRFCSQNRILVQLFQEGGLLWNSCGM